jgi:hypothetical protein
LSCVSFWWQNSSRKPGHQFSIANSKANCEAANVSNPQTSEVRAVRSRRRSFMAKPAQAGRQAKKSEMSERTDAAVIGVSSGEL